MRSAWSAKLALFEIQLTTVQ